MMPPGEVAKRASGDAHVNVGGEREGTLGQAYRMQPVTGLAASTGYRRHSARVP